MPEYSDSHLDVLTKHCILYIAKDRSIKVPLMLLGAFTVATYWLIIISLIYIPLQNCNKWLISNNLWVKFEWFLYLLIVI